MSDLLAKIRLGDFLHFTQDHGGNLFGRECLLYAAILDLDCRLAGLGDHLVGIRLDVLLHILVRELASDETSFRRIELAHCSIRDR